MGDVTLVKWLYNPNLYGIMITQLWYKSSYQFTHVIKNVMSAYAPLFLGLVEFYA